MIPISAQDVPDDIDDPTGDIDEVLSQLAEDDYITTKSSETVFEENRIRFEDDDEIFIVFDTPELTDFVMSATLQIDDVDDDEYTFCLLTFRDDIDDGFLAVGVTSFATIDLYDILFDEDDSLPIGIDDHDSDVDDEVHVLVLALEDEVTIYVDGELMFEEDDISVRDGVLGLLRSDDVECDADDVWIVELGQRNLQPTSRPDEDTSNDDDDDERHSNDGGK